MRLPRATSGRAALVLTAIAWLPLLLVALVERLSVGRVEPLLYDLAVHARALVALPLALFAGALLEVRVRAQLERLGADGILAPDELEPIADRCLEVMRAPSVELLLYATALVVGQLRLWGGLPGAFGLRYAWGPAALLYFVVTFPLFTFVIMRFIYRWAVWSVTLVALARRPLALDAVNPDRAGGIIFLSYPTSAFALFSFAVMAVASSAWGGEVLLHHVHASVFTESCFLLVAFLFLLAFAPLVAFGGVMRRARLRGQREYGLFVVNYVRRFHQRWIDKGPPGDEVLGSQDIQALSDLIQSMRVPDSMRPVPIDLRQLFQFLVAALVPLIPLALTEVPLSKLVLAAAQAVLGR